MLVDTLATTMRPQRFKDVVGQKAVVQRLQGTIKDKKIPKTIAFLGPYGTGKTTLARIYARYINCDTNNACGKCENCLAGDNHPDVEEINAANARGIDEVRALIERSTYAPRLANQRIYILDETQQWTPQAQQSILKSLEEPPPNTLFIICSMEPDKINPAILSRCSVFQLTHISKDDVKSRLQSILEKLKKKLPDSILEKIAELSGGHMRSAVQYLETVLQFAAAEKNSDPKALAKSLAKALSQSTEVKEEIVAMKVLLSIYTGSVKNVMNALMDSGDNIVMLNKMSQFNQYAIEKLLVNQHANLWHTQANTKFFTAVESRQAEKKISTGYPFLALLLKTTDAINTLKLQFGTFMLNERALLSASFIQLASSVKQEK